MSKFEEHVTTVLGAPSDAYDIGRGHPVAYRVLQFKDCPCAGAFTVLTSGLAVQLDQELIFCAYDKWIDQPVVTLLASVGHQLLASRAPLLRGDVLGPAGPLLPCTEAEAFCACPPTYFNVRLWRNGPYKFMWLIPLYRSEAMRSLDLGVDGFETALERLDPDLLDLARPPLSL